MDAILRICSRKSYIARIFVVLFISASAAYPQVAALSSVATPPSAQVGLAALTRSTQLPAVDHAALIAEDEAEIAQARATTGELPGFRSALPQDVSLSFQHGTWETLANGDRIWRLRIVSPGATDLCLRYDRWRLVKPCELWVYNDDLSTVLGPYTYIDNWDGTNATGFTLGDAVTVELYVPAGVEDIGELSISHVAHGYRHFLDRDRSERNPLDIFGSSMACEINARCWPDYVEERACVGMIFAPTFGRWCSGAMLNNTAQDGAPNFLTADHCFRTDINNWIIYFNYESPTCNPSADGPTNLTITNASVLARWASSDFLLIRLARNRPDGPYIPRYMGWYRNDIAPTQSWGIHHPAGDVKKISHDFNQAVSSDWNGVGPNTHWQVEWDEGITEGGSSGSPLFNTGSYVVGQLHGGLSDCVVETEETDKYGKLFTSWEGDGTSSGRLRDWLDPLNTGAVSQDSWQPTAPANDSCGPGQNVPVITYVPYSASGSTKWAADNHHGTVGMCTGVNTAPDVVYVLYLNCEYQITVSLCGSDYDTRLFVESGADCAIGGEYSNFCNDDFCGTGSQLTFTAQSGVPYKIWVDGYASAYGNYVLNVTGTASGSQGNAACPGYQITTVPYFTYGANWCGGDQVNPECRPTQDGDDVHWYWISPYNQAMRAKTCFINFDTILEVRVGNGAQCGQFEVGCNDDTPCGLDALASTVVFDASAGPTYYFHMDGFNGATGMSSFELEAYNDDCSSPIVVPSLPANYEGDTRAGQDDFATIVGPSSKELFFRYTSPTCQTVGVHTCDSYTTFDTGLEVRTGGPCPGSTVVTWNDDFCGDTGYKSQVTFSAEANRTYYIIISGYGTDAGNFMIYFYNIGGAPAAPLADVCPGINIPSLPFSDAGNTNCMANNYFNCVTTGTREMVYNMMRPQCEVVTVSLCGSGYDTGLGIYGGVCPNIAPLVICNDDNFCGGIYTLQSTATFTAEANTNYQFLVHGYSSGAGPYVINVTSTPCPPAEVNDAVVRFDVASGDAVLNWDPIPGADRYHIHRSSNLATLYDVANRIATVTTTSFTCEGCLHDAALLSFFGVVAEDLDQLTAPPAPRSLDGFTKADAVQGPEVLANELFPVQEIKEYAAPNK